MHFIVFKLGASPYSFTKAPTEQNFPSRKHHTSPEPPFIPTRTNADSYPYNLAPSLTPQTETYHFVSSYLPAKFHSSESINYYLIHNTINLTQYHQAFSSSSLCLDNCAKYSLAPSKLTPLAFGGVSNSCVMELVSSTIHCISEGFWRTMEETGCGLELR
ncbi:hypothetical protein BJ508DRAFT_100546 [Ascobolus immersus RN42]|uniref:Uncharacterized protein n=1 Tax=Ascobolus immersus RN42 TaxID=1160509 RepID=A0A3N4I9E1_ASCIM|nr:hypothetical protein BJ508DRAFT_100546 [Ascobolus immersus RN42]